MRDRARRRKTPDELRPLHPSVGGGRRTGNPGARRHPALLKTKPFLHGRERHHRRIAAP